MQDIVGNRVGKEDVRCRGAERRRETFEVYPDTRTRSNCSVRGFRLPSPREAVRRSVIRDRYTGDVSHEKLMINPAESQFTWLTQPEGDDVFV